MALTQEQYQAKLRAQRERRWTRKAEGRCIDCRQPHTTGHDRCAVCHEYHLEQTRKHKEKNRREGKKCVRCNRPLVPNIGKVRCPVCNEQEAFNPMRMRRDR